MFRWLQYKNGITRHVLLVGPLVLKVPRSWVSEPAGIPKRFLRGVLANQSEWRQRERSDANPPLFTLFHLVTVYRRADVIFTDWDEDWANHYECNLGYSAEEAKCTSWGFFTERGWKLIDYDRYWENPSLLGKLYIWHENRLSKKWSIA